MRSPQARERAERCVSLRADERSTSVATDNGLRSFADLRVGQKVEVEFDYRGGWHYASKIELED